MLRLMMAVFANNLKHVLVMILCLIGSKKLAFGNPSLDEVSISVDVDNEGDNVIENNVDQSYSNYYDDSDKSSSSAFLDYETLARKLQGKQYLLVCYVLLAFMPISNFAVTCNFYNAIACSTLQRWAWITFC